MTRHEFVSEPAVNLQLWLLQNEPARARGDQPRLRLYVLDEETARATGNSAPGEFVDALRKSPQGASLLGECEALVRAGGAAFFFTPRRAADANGAPLSERKTTQLRRRLHLIGESLESEQVWDICQAIRAVRTLPRVMELPLEVKARGTMAVNALYASLFVPGVARLDLADMPASHRDGPIYLNVLRHLDIPQAAAMAAERAEVQLATETPAQWDYASQIVRAMHWNPERLRIMAESPDPVRTPPR